MEPPDAFDYEAEQEQPEHLSEEYRRLNPRPGTKFALVAQRTEHRPSKPRVGGSKPSWGTKSDNKKEIHMTDNYRVELTSGEVIEVTGVGEIKQVFGFLEFRYLRPMKGVYVDPKELLIVAIRAETIAKYYPAEQATLEEIVAPAFKTLKAKPTRSTRKS